MCYICAFFESVLATRAIHGTKLQVQGQLLVDPAPLDVRVLNSGRDFLRVRAHVQGQGAGGRRSDTGAMNIGDLI